MARLPSLSTTVRSLGLPDRLVRAVEELQAYLRIRSTGLDAYVSQRDLIEWGFATEPDGTTRPPNTGGLTPVFDPGDVGSETPDLTPPPAPTGLTATGGYGTVFLEWDVVIDSRIGFFEVWRASVNNIGSAVKIGQTTSFLYVDNVQSSATFYYWVRAVNKWDVTIVSPFNAVSGTSATTSPNVPQLLDVLTGQLSESQLVASLNDRIDLVDDSGALATSVTARIQNWAYAKSTVYTKTEADSAITTQVNTVNARLNTGGDTYNSIVQAQTLASSKNATFVQSTAPTATKLNDLWIHTGDNNRVYRWNNSAWVLADDQRIGSISSQLTTLQSRVTASQPAVVHSWESGYVGWSNVNGSAEVSVISSADALVGGKVLQLGNNSGNDQWWGIGTDNIPLDNNTTYKITARYRRLLGTGAFYLGFAGVAADGTTYVNSAGANSTSSQFYTNTATPANTDWIETVGYLRVGGSGGINNNSLTNPIGVHVNVRYIRPLMITSYQGLPGQWEVDYIKIEPITNNVASLQVASNTYAGQLGDLEAQYTVKVDVNGYVSGFGLASTLNNATPFSEFAIVADKFSIAPVATSPGAADGSPFFHLTVPATIGGVTVPAGTYMKAAYIHDASITNAKIGNLAVDNAKIANVSAGKLVAGTLAVGQWIASQGYSAGTSGWRINADGSAEFSTATIRGTIYASLGAIGGIAIGSSYIQSNFQSGVSGFRINSNGSAEFNQVTVRGTIYATNGTFSGALQGATGTFSGALNAATGSFAGSLSAATGTFSGSLTAAAVNAVNTVNIAGQAVTFPNHSRATWTRYDGNYTVTDPGNPSGTANPSGTSGW